MFYVSFENLKKKNDTLLRIKIAFEKYETADNKVI